MSQRSSDFATFFQIVDDPEVFHFRGINLSKLFYDKWIDKHRRTVKEAKKTLRPNGGYLQRLYFSVRAFLLTYFNILYYALARSKPGQMLFFGASARYSRVDDVTYDTYNARIIDSRGRKRFVILDDYETGIGKTYAPDLYEQNLQLLFYLIAGWVFLLFGREIRSFTRRLVTRYPRLVGEFAVEKMLAFFYARYLVYRFLLASFGITRIVMVCHYTRLPIIAAGRSLGIPVTELMHGVIIKKHPHYAIPNLPAAFVEPFRKYLLPDRLGVYGPFWKAIVDQGREFDPASVFVAGYYLKLPPIRISTDKGSKTIILISSQTTVQKEVVNYVRFLKHNLDRSRWQVIVKPHPSENHAPFLELLEPGFIELSLENIYSQLGKAHIHISVRSTVLFEAIQYGVCNYVLLADSLLDECMEIVETGVARALKPDELPALYTVEPAFSEYYFAEYCPEQIFAS